MRQARKARICSTNIVVHGAMTTVQQAAESFTPDTKLSPRAVPGYSEEYQNKIEIARRGDGSC